MTERLHVHLGLWLQLSDEKRTALAAEGAVVDINDLSTSLDRIEYARQRDYQRDAEDAALEGEES
jgi:hypothetical protein